MRVLLIEAALPDLLKSCYYSICQEGTKISSDAKQPSDIITSVLVYLHLNVLLLSIDFIKPETSISWTALFCDPQSEEKFQYNVQIYSIITCVIVYVNRPILTLSSCLILTSGTEHERWCSEKHLDPPFEASFPPMWNQPAANQHLRGSLGSILRSHSSGDNATRRVSTSKIKNVADLGDH